MARSWAEFLGDAEGPYETEVARRGFAARLRDSLSRSRRALTEQLAVAAFDPGDASSWERLGRLRLRLMDRSGAVTALEEARRVGPSVEGLLDLALAYHLIGDVGAEVSAAHAATQVAPESPAAWSTYAHSLARTDRVTECVAACRQALTLSDDPEVADLLARVEASRPRGLEERTAA